MLGCSDWEPSPCLLRFDLIFLMLDPQDEAYDRRLAHHLVSLYYQSEEEAQEEGMDMAVLRDYIAYAHSTVMPRLSQDASQALIEVPAAQSAAGPCSALKRSLVENNTVFYNCFPSCVAKLTFPSVEEEKGLISTSCALFLYLSSCKHGVFKTRMPELKYR